MPTDTTTPESWPKGCLIENAAVHPTQPWLAVACTNAETGQGAVMVFDLLAGVVRSVATHDNYVGWCEPSLLRWHGEGQRLATNIGTNGIAVVEGTHWVGAIHPDETRDSGVGYVWVDERVFTDTGSLVEISEGDIRFDLPTLDGPEFDIVEWNAKLGAVVGRVGPGIAAYDPVRERVIYERSGDELDEQGKGHTPLWAPDGRWCLVRRFNTHPAPDELVFINGDTGRVHGVRQPSSPRIARLVWGPVGALALSCHVHHIGGPQSGRHVDLFFGGELRVTLDLGPRELLISSDVADATSMAWSPEGWGLALLLDGQEVRVHDAQSGRALSSFVAKAPPPPRGLPGYYARRQAKREIVGGLMWGQQQRIVRIAPHFVSVWSMDGQAVGEFVVPT